LGVLVDGHFHLLLQDAFEESRINRLSLGKRRTIQGPLLFVLGLALGLSPLVCLLLLSSGFLFIF